MADEVVLAPAGMVTPPVVEPPAAAPATSDPGAAAPPPAAAPASSWRNSLPEAMRGSEALAKYDSADQAVQALLDKQPPADAAAYALKAPEGLEANQPLSDAFARAALDAGLSPAQATKVNDFYNKLVTDGIKANQQQMEVGVSALKAEWGSQYDANVAAAQRGMKNSAGDLSTDLSALLESSGAGNHPLIIKYFAQLDKLLGEDKFVASSPGRKPDTPKSDEEVLYPNMAQR